MFCSPALLRAVRDPESRSRRRRTVARRCGALVAELLSTKQRRPPLVKCSTLIYIAYLMSGACDGWQS